MKMTSLQKMIAVVVLIVGLAAAVVAFVILPQFAQLADLQQQKTDAEARSAQAAIVLETLRGAKGRAAVTEAELLKIGTQMPDSPQLPALIMELQDIANTSGVKVSSLSPGQPTIAAGGQYTEISMSEAVTAEWDDLLDYLKRVDRSTRLLRVTSVSITPPASTNDTSTAAVTALTVSVTMKAYVIGANGAVSSAANPPAGTP